MLEVIHDGQITEHGGSPGVRDDGLLESALGRPQQKWSYDPRSDLASLAASYGFGLTKNHGYVGGNKRTAFMAAYVFLGLNGQDLETDELDVATIFERLASGLLSETALADWFRQRIRRLA